ncbi:MAG: LCP family protein [Oscillospiraceae bacterium]|nr:LCP family protein [Oscillospiraceae bacterium]
MKTNWKHRFLTVLCIILAVILALLLGLTILVNSFLNKIQRYDPVEETISEEEIQQIIEETDPPELIAGLEEIPPEEVIMDEPAEIIEKPDHIYNILLIGQDARPGEGRQRSDSMILCTINTEKKTLMMTSFLRDTYVDIPDFQDRTFEDNRLNACYAFGGVELLNNAMELNFGIEIDHNIEVNFTGFERIVNTLGGVYIYLTQAEANIVGGGAIAGMNLLNGAQALRYSQIRSLDSDFGRTNRQRTVLLSMYDSIRRLNPDQISSLVNVLLTMVTTDMTNTDIVKYVVEFVPLLPDLQITTQHIPAVGTYTGAMVRGMSVLIPDLEANREILRETLGK